MKNNKENGRSMVEMLGVLAIIGVLSIGGIAGYTMAMNRYKANRVLDIMAKMSTSFLTILSTNPNISSQHVSNTMNDILKSSDFTYTNSSYCVARGDDSYCCYYLSAYETSFEMRGNSRVFAYPSKISNTLASITGQPLNSAGYFILTKGND